MLKPGTPEYHSFHSQKWFKNLTPEERRERNKIRTQKRQQKKAKWVQYFGGKCHDCNQKFIDCVFDFHHVDLYGNQHAPAKLFMLSDERIKNELDKCVMLCSNCHRIRHNEDKYSFHRKNSLNYLGNEYS